MLGVQNRCSIICISPLKSIISDQIAEIESLNCTAAELLEENLDEISRSPPQFIFCSAEMATDKRFLNALKNNDILRSSIQTVVVDECHTVETWTGKR
jgi:superfamily II DNA helicase RecQ